MDEQRPKEKQQLALIEHFAKETWIALGAAVLCLSIDAYAMFSLPHHPTAERAVHHGFTFFSVAIWTLQIVLALLALWLVRFGFSRPSRLIQEL